MMKDKSKIGILGFGEVGQAIAKFYSSPKFGGAAKIKDIKRDDGLTGVEILHICIPWSNNFVKIVKKEIKKIKPKLTIIHSTIPPKITKKIGGMIGEGWKRLAKKHGIKVGVHPPEAIIGLSFEYENKLEIKTLFNQEMLKRGLLATDHVFVSYAHKEEHVKKYLESVDEVFGIVSKAIKDNKVKELLEGPVVHSGFKRLVQ